MSDPDAPHGYRILICGSCGSEINVPIHCHSKTCRFCAASRSWRVQKRITWVLSKVSRSNGCSWRHITLTVPNTPNLEECLTFLVKAFRKLRSSKPWKTTQSRGFYVIEVTKTGPLWHPHLHVISYGFFIPWQLLLQQWHRASGTGRHIRVRQIGSGDSIARYVAKYVSKVPALQKDDSITLDDVTLHRRMFSYFGDLALIFKQFPFPKFKRTCTKCGNHEWIPDFLLERYEKQAYLGHRGGKPRPSRCTSVQ